MTSSVHVPVETISDLVEGLLSPDEAADVRVHLAECAVCEALAEQVRAVPATLAAEAATPLVAPTAVVEALDAAIKRAQAERAAGVVHLSERSGRTQTPVSSRRPRRVLLPAAAAAAVVCLSVVSWQSLNTGVGPATRSGSVTQADGRANSPIKGAAQGFTAIQGGGQLPTTDSAKKSPHPFDLNQPTEPSILHANPAATVRAAARTLVADKATGSHVAPVCAVPADGGISILYPWRGDESVLNVQPNRDIVDILGCHSPSRVLFRTSFQPAP